MRVVRTMPDEGWVPISNEAARDHRLSWRARGLLAELLSYPDGWETSVDKLVAQARRHGDVSEGRAAMRKAIAELADAGYVTYERSQDKRGHWVTEMVVSDQPDANGADRRTKNRTVGIPAPRLADTSETETSDPWSVTNKTHTNTFTKTDLQRRTDEHSTSLASLATAADAAAQMRSEVPTLDEVYQRVNRMTANGRHKGLLDLERRRPRIYRECRRSAIAQTKRQNAKVFNEKDSAIEIDRLSYQYAVQHYYPDLPPWLKRPIAEAATS